MLSTDYVLLCLINLVFTVAENIDQNWTANTRTGTEFLKMFWKELLLWYAELQLLLSCKYDQQGLQMLSEATLISVSPGLTLSHVPRKTSKTWRRPFNQSPWIKTQQI